MLLHNLQLINENNTVSLHLKNGKINAIGDIKNVTDKQTFNFEDAIVFPGLINSHDHLDFNLFPQLGNRKYDNYVEWGNDIHKQNKGIINDVLKVPQQLRIRWGIYKNILNGVTTVVNHGPQITADNTLINVFQKSHHLHSVQFEKNWKFKLNRPFIKKWPFAVHVGEGIDDVSHKEIRSLIKWNLWNRTLVGIHGIAMDAHQAKSFKALVWCPASNQFLIGKTAPIDELKHQVRVIFGTDSTLSASWNIWDHLRFARSTKYTSDESLYKMLNTRPANVWQLEKYGKLKENYNADIVIARQKNNLHGFDAFYALNPEDILMVIRGGNIMLLDESLLKQITDSEMK